MSLGSGKSTPSADVLSRFRPSVTTALKVTIKPTRDGNINFKAGVSIFKQQFVPTVITMCFFSPVVIAQIWGMIKQSKLDEKDVAITEQALYQIRTISLLSGEILRVTTGVALMTSVFVV